MDTIQELNEFTQSAPAFAAPSRNVTGLSPPRTAGSESNFVAIPLVEKPPIICLGNDSDPHPQHQPHPYQHQKPHPHSHPHPHPGLTQISVAGSCFERFRDSFLKFFGKIMGSTTPSEADKYEYYDCKWIPQNFK